MATIREIKTLLKPLLQRHHDLEIVGRELIVKPVRHHLRTVLIDRTSSANRVSPRWYIHHLFSPRLSPHISWGESLSGKKGYLWETSDPAMQADLIEQIESVALPILRRIETLDDFTATIMERWQGHHLINDDWTRIAIEFALGNVDQAREYCTEYVCNFADPGPKAADVWRSKILGTQKLCRLLQAGDVASGVALLHEWERQTVKILKIEHHWQPTPFPVEKKLRQTR
jgi:hypothetical protein